MVALRGVVDFLWVPRRLGSSKEKLSTNTCLLGGFIPAWAGQPSAKLVDSGASAVYPRVGWATCDSVRNRPVIMGLSPRGRGNLVTLPFLPAVQRSIPAWAGQPQRQGTGVSMYRVYPRVGGATLVFAWCQLAGVGLSPRGRGNHSLFRWRWPWVRSIPAWAG